MRAVFVLLLAVAALASLVPAVTAESAAPPRNLTLIAVYNDSQCSQHMGNRYEPNPSSPECVADPYHLPINSIIFQCDTAYNLTSLRYTAYDHTSHCDNAPLVNLVSLAPAHSCAPILATYMGMTQIKYARITCREEGGSGLDAAAAVARQPSASKQHTATSSIAELVNSKRFNELFA